MSAGVLTMPAALALELTAPLPGFPAHRDYALVAADGDGLLFWLQSIDPAGPRFLAVPAAAFFPGYAPPLAPAVCAELGLGGGDQPAVYCLVTVPGGDIRKATANLLAPIAVNPQTRRARQIVLRDGSHPIRQPLRR